MTGPQRGEGRDKRLCGGRRRDGTGETCRRPAGWGTDHPGHGPCKLHGGSTPNHAKAAQTEIAKQKVATYGLPREVEPAQALLEEVHRTAGHVAWLAQVVADLQHDGDGYSRETTDDGDVVLRPRSGLKQLDQSGKFEKPSVWVELYQAERKHLTAVAKAAVDAGVELREIHLIERHMNQFVGVIRGIFTRLGIDASPGTQAAEAAQAELRALVGGGPGG